MPFADRDDFAARVLEHARDLALRAPHWPGRWRWLVTAGRDLWLASPLEIELENERRAAARDLLRSLDTLRRTMSQEPAPGTKTSAMIAMMPASIREMGTRARQAIVRDFDAVELHARFVLAGPPTLRARIVSSMLSPFVVDAEPTPHVRDVSLLAICAGDLPEASDWRNLSLAEVLRREDNGIRAAIRAIPGLREPRGGRWPGAHTV